MPVQNVLKFAEQKLQYAYYTGLKLSSDPLPFLHKYIYIINPVLISKKLTQWL